MIERTFNEWKKLGYIIVKGSKHVGRNERGEPLFNEEQVYEPDCPFCGQTAEYCVCSPYDFRDY